MYQPRKARACWLILLLLLCLTAFACKSKETKSGLKELPDLNEQYASM